MSDTHDAQLEADSMTSIDLFLDSLKAYVDALMTGNHPEALVQRATVRSSLATWGALIINRADGRTARLLVSVLQQVDELAQEIGAIKAGATERHAMLEEILRRLPPRPAPLEAAHD
jgi:hypothetical protein